MLRVTRKQFPLAPGFATTAHAAQGQTCPEGVLMDMHIGDAGDPLAVYIALTRVKNRYGLFVYRPFAAAPFQKGAKKGRELLLRFWGGEHMDWAFLRAKYRDEKLCSERKEQKPVGAFTPGRWNNFLWPLALQRQPMRPKDKLVRKAFSWTCTLGMLGIHWPSTLL